MHNNQLYIINKALTINLRIEKIMKKMPTDLHSTTRTHFTCTVMAKIISLKKNLVSTKK